MRMIPRVVGAMICVLALVSSNATAQYDVLHYFSGTTNGFGPHGSLTLHDSTLYGMTSGGGGFNLGLVFKMNLDGTQFTTLHSFGFGGDGRYPYDSLTLHGSTLYGMTEQGGSGNSGAIFAMDTGGLSFNVLYSFVNSNGIKPHGSLTLDEENLILYGMTGEGAVSNGGTAFRVNADGSGFTVLHYFQGGTDDGFRPYGSLTLSGATLYGMTYGGGASNRGTVFKMNTDGGDFELLHSFAGGVDDGATPYGSLTLSGSTLYGMTYGGGANGGGTVFQMNTDGTDFRVLHSFVSGTNEGFRPYGSITLAGSVLYGMTSQGGLGGGGGGGTAFSLVIPEPSSIALTVMGALVLLGCRRKS